MSKTKTTKTASKKSASKSSKPANGSDKKLSAIDAAAKVLGESKVPMNSKE